MKKVVLTAVAVLGFAFANAQSHQKGTMQVNVMGGFLTGSGSSQDDAAGSEKGKFTATGGQFGAHFQYGIAESFSLGLGLEGGTIVATPKDNNGFDTTEPSINTFKVMVTGRYYFVNKEKFNVYGGPSIGYTTAKDDTVYGIGGFGFDQETKLSGLNYGVNVGGNYFFTDIVGVIVNLGYEGNGLKSTTTYGDGSPEDTGKTNIGGVKIMAGLALKF
ncbi:MAG: outer membrane beta-barrel protein [Bacteroidota bacterium]